LSLLDIFFLFLYEIMKHLAAYLLLNLTNPNPTRENITTLLNTVGIVPDKERLDNLFTEIEGKDIHEVPHLTPQMSRLNSIG
jgi:ribosomal protein L12E/L44/L45/RPP1/RPP2